MTPFALTLRLFFARMLAPVARQRIARRAAQGELETDRLAQFDGSYTSPRDEGELVWFHADTVPTAWSILELVRRLSEEDETLVFLVSTGAEPGEYPEPADLPDQATMCYLPHDMQNPVAGFLDHWRPDILVWSGAEIRPCLFLTCRDRKVPMVGVGLDLPQPAHRLWRFFGDATGYLFDLFRVIHVSNPETHAVLTEMGVDGHKILISGPLQDSPRPLPYIEEERQAMTTAIGRRTAWLAASITAREEDQVIAAYREVLRRAPRALLILNPRETGRSDALLGKLRDAGWRVAHRDAGDPLLPDTEVYVTEDAEELGLWYRIAPVCFVGGSLSQAPTQNPMEAAALGSAIIHGNLLNAHLGAYDRLKQAGGSIEVFGAEGLATAVVQLLAPDRAANLAHAAWEVSSSGAEVADQVVETILDNIGVPG